ncbi:hypothetical protein Y032_0009g801 [Ancylostoma ceylanicum]|uniref:Uncharacterized protein n=1 Tax=Ancylostoma ceylanicum TaxID=53326 RepID=A0A016VJY4_9BILA|nr:hypothetical protein Y032_0009g801 [Ancylostoma ceylanicum]
MEQERSEKGSESPPLSQPSDKSGNLFVKVAVNRSIRCVYCLSQKLEQFNVLRAASQSAFYLTSNHSN